MVEYRVEFPVAGVTFEGRQRVVEALADRVLADLPVEMRLVPEPDNPHDPDAIRVEAELGGRWTQVGYVPRSIERPVEGDVRLVSAGRVQGVGPWGVLIEVTKR